jgi:pyruvate carboxylase
MSILSLPLPSPLFSHLSFAHYILCLATFAHTRHNAGKVVKVLVKEGDQVDVGQSLLILEAMKMEHTIKAPIKGRVKQILYRVGDLVEENKLLVTLTPL